MGSLIQNFAAEIWPFADSVGFRCKAHLTCANEPLALLDIVGLGRSRLNLLRTICGLPASNCLLTVVNIDGVAGDEVVAQDLTEKQDDIIIKVGGERFPSSGEVEFSRVGQGHSAAAFARHLPLTAARA